MARNALGEWPVDPNPRPQQTHTQEADDDDDATPKAAKAHRPRKRGRSGSVSPSQSESSESSPSLPSSPSPAERRYPRAHVEEVEDEEATSLPNAQRSKKRAKSDNVPPSNPFPDPHPRTRPSDYLRSRCPLCFGGSGCIDPEFGSDYIVCLDACFTHKEGKGVRDPVRTHPFTLFVPEGNAKRMEKFADETRGKRPTGNKRRKTAADTSDKEEAEEQFEGPLKVLPSVLDECESGFKAADEARIKGNAQMFASTALMGLLCRHDRVLWVVNMVSAGEKQHYALSLLETFFQHIPTTTTVGILYDIGCQLHRSCIKWDFLGRYLDRITFGISVFHAYGHQWPCQVIYHPRKCCGFGLSDGEGCERFWHSISKLISYLRTVGVSVC